MKMVLLLDKLTRLKRTCKSMHCTHVQSVKKNIYLFQHKLSYGNETGTNHHGLLSTTV